MGSAVKRAVVTGGARGIGEAIARRLADEGMRVGIVDVLEPEGRAVAESLSGTFTAVDLSDAAAAEAGIGAAIDSLGGVDVLVNSAGAFGRSSLLDLNAADWDRVMAVNARGTLIAMQAAARRMLADGGRIINVASMAAKHRGDGEGHYAASKAAVLALTRAAALEWGQYGITVNALCPGYVLTDLGADTRTSEQVAAWTALSPLGRLGTPWDIAGIAAFLAGPDGGYFTGQALNVTGGMVMH